jgi:hypothetical protein
MNKRTITQWLRATFLMVFFLSGCNFPVFRAATATEISGPAPETETQTKLPPAGVETVIPSATSTYAPTETSTPTITSTQGSTPTNTVLPTAAATNTLVPTPTRHLVVSIRGTALVEKNTRFLPLGGASVSLYNDQTRALVTGTKTNIEGGFQINELYAGNYYLVLVWFVKSSGWPCAKSSLPDPEHKAAWDYVVHGLAHHVMIQYRDNDTYVVSIGTSAFGFDGKGTKQVEVYLKCNALN